MDFFAGSGLVSEGLKEYFNPVWANDISPKKADVFCGNHPKGIFTLGPIEKIKGFEIPDACLSWASFPCQDLSLAGSLGGLSSERSGLVWQWLRIMDEMKERPPLAVAENVIGLISADQGAHYRRLHKALARRGYKIGAVILDASCWLPQSRKRVFVIAVKRDINTRDLESRKPLWCHPVSLQKAAEGLEEWVWWRIPKPSVRPVELESLIDFKAQCYDETKTAKLLEMVPAHHKAKMNYSYSSGRSVFPGYRRIRHGKQVLELRFDGMAGCLRTPEGGSSRQYLIIRRNGSFNARLITAAEAAALMGVRAGYKIPGSYNDAYKAMGDAVAVPVTRYLARHLLAPLARIISEHSNELG